MSLQIPKRSIIYWKHKEEFKPGRKALAGRIIMNWFINVFLPSFQIGKEVRITEKQFGIFQKYLKPKNSNFNGYTEEYFDTINGLRILAYVWSSKAGDQYFLKIEKI